MVVFNIFDQILLQIQFGDPSLLGWLTVAAYLVAAMLCTTCILLLDRIFPNEPLFIHRLIWVGLALGTLFLGVNKQLDLQTPLTRMIKGIAYQQGWYEWGQTVQILLVGLLAGVSTVIVLVVAWLVRRVWKQYWILLFGVLFLARFIVVRVASIYGVPLLELSRWTGGIRITWLMELVGALLVALAAAYNLLRNAQRQSPTDYYTLH